ncbi:MAG: hypothetical protein SWY16_07835 [Cyanobacteriota bacterium]|nr:hypothetical protein [Cyanobacteriota bacterium]
MVGSALIGTCGLLLPIGIWAVAAEASVLVLVWGLLAIVFFPLRLHPWHRLGQRLTLLVILLLASPLWGYLALGELMWRQEQLSQKLQNSGPEELSRKNKVAIYGGNLIMATGGYLLGLPEVAMETVLLSVPGSSVREFESDFAWASAKVRTPIEAFIDRLPEDPGATEVVRMPPTTIEWTAADYLEGEGRVALALNPFELEAVAYREGEGWRIECSGTVAIEYDPSPGRTELLKLPGLTVGADQSLFWALQEEGWLHPYTARWRWTRNVDAGDSGRR